MLQNTSYGLTDDEHLLVVDQFRFVLITYTYTYSFFRKNCINIWNLSFEKIKTIEAELVSYITIVSSFLMITTLP